MESKIEIYILEFFLLPEFLGYKNRDKRKKEFDNLKHLIVDVSHICVSKLNKRKKRKKTKKRKKRT